MGADTHQTIIGKKDDWATPNALFNKLDEEFNFTLDACASDENAKCEKYYTIKENAIFQDWKKDSEGGAVFMNPPYSEVSAFMRKAYMESQKGITVVVLVYSKTDTRWFHDFVYGKAEIRFIKGRVKFKGGKGFAPYPSMIVVYRPGGDTHKYQKNWYNYNDERSD